MFYKLVNNYSLSAASVSVAFGLILVSRSSFLGYNARIAPSEEISDNLKIISKIASN